MNRILCLCMASLLLFSACRSRKKGGKIAPVKQDTSAAFRMQSDQQKLEKYAFSSQYLTLEGTIEQVRGAESSKYGLNIRMLKDSLIWIRISKAGLEGARILINRDSLFVIDRVHTEYYVYPVSYLESMYKINLSFNDIQNLLVGNLIFREKTYERVDSAGGLVTIGWKDESYKCQTVYNPEIYRPVVTEFKEKKTDRKTHIRFLDFDALNGQNLPRKISMDIFFGKEPSKVEISYSSAHTNPIAEFPFFIPSNYERKH